MSAEWRFLVTLNERLRPLRDAVEIQKAAVGLLGEHLQVNRVHYAQIEGDEFVIRHFYVNLVAPSPTRGVLSRLGPAILDACRRGETIIINDVGTDPRLPEDTRERLLGRETTAIVAAPLIKEGRWVATFSVHSAKPRVWTADEVALVELTADRTWAAAARALAEEALGEREERLAFLLRLNDTLRPLSDPGEVQETASRLLAEHLGVTRSGYAEVEGREYVIRREYTRGVKPLVGQRPLGSVSAALAPAFRRGDTVVVSDVETDPRFTDDERAAMRTRQIAAMVAVTLLKGGRMVAAFGVNNVTPRVWTPAEIGLVRDVAERTWDAVERTRAEAELRRQTYRLGLALDASAGGSWTWDLATNHVDWDERLRALYGFAPGEPWSSDEWLSRVHEDDRALALALRHEMLTSTTKDSWEHTFRIVRRDGSVAWVQSRGRADRDADGRVTRLAGLDLDFTRHHHLEEALQAERDEEHHRALRLLLETATQGIVSVDAQGTVITANHTLEEMFGWGRGELIGQSIERLMPSVFRDTHAQHRAAYFTTPHPRLMGGGLNLVGERKNGSTFPIEVSLNHVATSGGGRAFAFVTDITERHRAASALHERTTELEYRTTQLSRMASDLTLAEQTAREQIAKTLHDGLQQLLVIVSLNLEQLLKREGEADPDSIELLAQARHHLDEAIEAARSLNFELYPPVLQHSGLPAALTWLANWTTNRYKLDVAVTTDARADSTRKDVRTLLFESVRELLFNVVKHAQVDTVALDLALDADDRLCITVADQGIGFDPIALDDRSKGGDVGWGLFSIRERVTLLGGRLDIESAPGKGTRFRLVAPRGADQPVAVQEHAVPVVAGGPGKDARSLLRSADTLRILIVDDHVAVRTALRQILHERPQLSVVGDAANGYEAVALAYTLQPDVILMDVSMPHMDGVEATRRIHAAFPSIRILGLSMQARPQEVHAIEQAGAADFFVKGVDTERLISHLLHVHSARPADAGAEP